MSIQDLERSLAYAKKVRVDVDSAIAGIEYLIARERAVPGELRGKTTGQVESKPYDAMTDNELVTELQTLETAQSRATGWGAAVGVRGEYIDEIKWEQRRRREVRAEDTFGGLLPHGRLHPPWSTDGDLCDGCGKRLPNGQVRWSDGNGKVYHIECIPGDK